MPPLFISAHATVRYCERVLEFDLVAFQKAMTELVGDHKEGRFKIPGHDVVAVVNNRTIVTFVPYAGKVAEAEARHNRSAEKKLRKQRFRHHAPWPDDEPGAGKFPHE